jgi:hypothetical protein
MPSHPEENPARPLWGPLLCSGAPGPLWPEENWFSGRAQNPHPPTPGMGWNLHPDMQEGGSEKVQCLNLVV